MAEGLLGGVLGEEDEKPQPEATEALAGAEAFAAAIAAIASRQDPKVADRTAEFLLEQTELLKEQKEILRDEHALRLVHLSHQSHLLLGQRLGQAIRLAFQIVIALVVIVIGIGIAVMLHDAFTSRSVVIDAFSAPAAIAARGVTGAVVASDVLDELARLQTAAFRGFNAPGIPHFKRTLSNGWSNEVKVDVPETGISLGELSRLLTARFGHDLHIGGDLVETPSGGLALTVRGASFSPRTFAGSAGGLDALAVDAAQYVYSQFQPRAWALYLSQSGRCPESIAFIKTVYASADASSRASMLNDWANCLGEIGGAGWRRQSLFLYREVIRLNPDAFIGYTNEQQALVSLGDEEAAWRAAEAFRQRASARLGTGAGFWLAQGWDPLTKDLQAELDSTIAYTQANGGVGADVSDSSNSWGIALLEVQLHDPTAAALTLQTLEGSPSPAASVEMHFLRGLLAEETGDVAQAATEMEAFSAAVADPRIAHDIDISELNNAADDECQVAWIEEAAGHPDKADAALRAGGHYVDCGRFRGDILGHRGDWAGAQQAYAAAVALAPDLPSAYYSWGVALARHGDIAGALAKLRDANQRGPHWADPLKAWGDVLAKQGHWKDALAKYDEALKYAPGWAALEQARQAASGKNS